MAKKFNGEIISADSRQVYKGMDIGTGKDLPVNSKFHLSNPKLEIGNSKLGYYLIQGIKLWGYDLVNPKEEFSVANYLLFVKKIIPDILNRKKLPIVVGGTGFYVKAIVDGIPTLEVPRNSKLREMLMQKNATELYETLSVLNSLKAGSLNSSDKKNPRRLVRAIEVAQYLIDHQLPIDRSAGKNNNDYLFIGLNAQDDFIADKINIRVEERIKNGFPKEVDKLINSGVDWSDQSMVSLGYRQWRDYYEGAVDKSTAISEWKKEERKYAKRQMIWYKKDLRIKWFDISQPFYQKKVENMIQKWYPSNIDTNVTNGEHANVANKTK